MHTVKDIADFDYTGFNRRELVETGRTPFLYLDESGNLQIADSAEDRKRFLPRWVGFMVPKAR